MSCTLSGGGSRASFQIGALDYLYRRDPAFTPSIFVGASAGSILASGLAQFAEREDQRKWVDAISTVWLEMRDSADMFTPRPWYSKLQDEGPAWLEIVQPPHPPPPKPPSRTRLQFWHRRDDEPRPLSPPSPSDPVELALTPDEELRAEWSLQHLSLIASNVSRLPRIGSDMSAIWSGLENTRSMYRPGPVLKSLLDPGVFDPGLVANSGMTLRIAMVALESGEVRYMTEHGTLVGRDNEPFDDDPKDLVLGLLASCSIPAVFRPVPIGDETYVDGGTRENLPAELTIGWLGASRNYVISSQSGGVQRRANMADDDIFSIVMRSTEILIDEAGRDELEYAISAGATVIYPDVNVHDPMLVHPGLIAINRDHGWMRAAEVVQNMAPGAARRHSRIIEQRMRCLTLEQRLIDDPTSQDARNDVEHAKYTLRAMMPGADAEALPPGAEDWWRTFEKHREPVDIDVWWLEN